METIEWILESEERTRIAAWILIIVLSAIVQIVRIWTKKEE